ncbi:hypothetical protein GPECTOR_49g531 [Gonium pectorale]|uniref:Uncharacterized protein n=1 Tax=Gonium pectorale TaxID=33097 RepID=A0A150G7X3_GONPE|nr:hypothetical protein GPECTOR_49g531 [Gonium pectorale]|eukprot:KXZ45947.1 hypothetical protein GPECTOR_49g531 [Gonium pectorale]
MLTTYPVAALPLLAGLRRLRTLELWAWDLACDGREEVATALVSVCSAGMQKRHRAAGKGKGKPPTGGGGGAEDGGGAEGGGVSMDMVSAKADCVTVRLRLGRLGRLGAGPVRFTI